MVRYMVSSYPLPLGEGQHDGDAAGGASHQVVGLAPPVAHRGAVGQIDLHAGPDRVQPRVSRVACEVEQRARLAHCVDVEVAPRAQPDLGGVPPLGDTPWPCLGHAPGRPRAWEGASPARRQAVGAEQRVGGRESGHNGGEEAEHEDVRPVQARVEVRVELEERVAPQVERQVAQSADVVQAAPPQPAGQRSHGGRQRRLVKVVSVAPRRQRLVGLLRPARHACVVDHLARRLDRAVRRVEHVRPPVAVVVVAKGERGRTRLGRESRLLRLVHEARLEPHSRVRRGEHEAAVGHAPQILRVTARAGAGGEPA
mmetsp:Transcript_33918/g.106469  ORF Transcript_33918/g.106469 Transcript_33918/m.106469 type:complete len:312 (+) Transcript_33918:119-1054(+)